MGDLAEDGIPVTVSCRVLKLGCQPHYRWLAHLVTESELTETYRSNTLLCAHRDDPEYGYRFLADEAADAGQVMARWTAWRIYFANGWFSVFGKNRRSKAGKPGPPVHEDLVGCDFSADVPNGLWLGDITEHRTLEGKLYLFAIKDAFSKRVFGYSIDSRLKSRIAVNPLNNTVARRGDVAGCILHTDRGSQFRFRKHIGASHRNQMVGSKGRVGAAGGNAVIEPFVTVLQDTSWIAESGPLVRNYASRSSPGSKGPTTGTAGKTASGN